MPPDYRIQGRQIAERRKIPWNIFNAMIQQESGWRDDARNPSGATGLGQLMPATAAGLGVDPRNPVQNLEGAATYLSQQYDKYGRWDLALAAYNAGPGNVDKYNGIPPFAETQNYVKTIMSNAHAIHGGAAPGGPAPALVDPYRAPDPLASQAPSPTPQPGLSLSALLGNASPSPRSVGILQGLGGMASKAAQAAQAPIPLPLPRQHAQLASQEIPASGPGPQPVRGENKGGDWSDWVGAIEHRQGPSPSHNEGILRFVGQIGKAAGTKLTPWGNESHSLTTTTGNRSAHADGNAADIPATGKELIRLGRVALVQAGMSPQEASKINGGLFNIGGYQVIFNTQVGGDHTNHVHVGLRGR